METRGRQGYPRRRGAVVRVAVAGLLWSVSTVAPRGWLCACDEDLFNMWARRIGKSIHFPQVADLRSRHCNRTLGMAESCRKVVFRPQITVFTVFDLAEEHEGTG